LVYLVIGKPWLADLACRRGHDCKLSDPPLAVQFYTRAARLDPTKDIYWRYLANESSVVAQAFETPHERRYWHDLSRAAAERACSLVPADCDNFATLARVLTDAAVEAEATRATVYAAFDRALTLDPNRCLLAAEACRAALQLGDVVQAKVYLQHGQARSPELPTLTACQGYIALVERRPAEAAALFESALASPISFFEPERRLRTQSALAEALLQLECYEEARRTVLEVLREHPDWSGARRVLAQALEKLGRRGEAEISIERKANSEQE